MKDRAAASAFIALLAVVIHKALSEKLSKHNGWRGGVTFAVPSSSTRNSLLSKLLPAFFLKNGFTNKMQTG